MSTRYEVVITVTDPLSGGALVTTKHPCMTAAHARILLGNISELVEELAEYLPGLAVAAYEVQEVVSVTPSGLAALVASLPESRRNPAWLAQAAAQE